MKKAISLFLALVIVLMLTACGNNEQEKKEVNEALQGTWYTAVDVGMFGQVAYIYTFKNGECTFDSVSMETQTSYRSTEGTYTVDSKNHTIEVQYNDNISRSIKYAYDSGNLSLYDGTNRLTKR